MVDISQRSILDWLTSPIGVLDVRFIILYSLSLLAFSIYVRYVLKNLRPGLVRTLFALPALALLVYSLATIQFTDIARIVILMPFSQQASFVIFKVLEFCLNRGPFLQTENIFQTFFMMTLPVSPENGPVIEADRSYFKWTTQFVIGSIAAFLYFLEIQSIPPLIRTYFLGVWVMCFVSLPYDKPMRQFIEKVFGIPFNKSMTNEVYKSQSIAEFWNLRWNYYGGKFFRDIGYTPFVEGRLVSDEGTYNDAYLKQKQGKLKPSYNQLIAACFGTFLVSAISHQFPFWFVFKNKWNVGQFWFFTLQAPLVLVERQIYRSLQKQGI